NYPLIRKSVSVPRFSTIQGLFHSHGLHDEVAVFESELDRDRASGRAAVGIAVLPDAVGEGKCAQIESTTLPDSVVFGKYLFQLFPEGGAILDVFRNAMVQDKVPLVHKMARARQGGTIKKNVLALHLGHTQTVDSSLRRNI